MTSIRERSGSLVTPRAGTWLPVRRRAATSTRAIGAAAALVYVAGDVICGLRYAGYSFRDQAISELSALGSPVRPVMVTFLTAHGLLLCALAVQLRRAGGRRAGPGGVALRRAGAFLLGAALVGLVLHPFFPMSSRGMAGGRNDTLHVVLTGAFVLLVVLAVLLVAAACAGPIRWYSLGSVLAMAVFGALAATRAPTDIRHPLPTPDLGTFERLNAYTYLAWLVVLAAVLLGRQDPHDPHDPRAGGDGGEGAATTLPA